MRVADEIREKLEAAFAPHHLEIEDESERHRGHAGYQEGGQSHFRVAISSLGTKGTTELYNYCTKSVVFLSFQGLKLT